MEEILNISDRIAVMHEGEITGVLNREHCNEQNVMQLAIGKKIPDRHSPHLPDEKRTRHFYLARSFCAPPPVLKIRAFFPQPIC